LDQPTGLGYSNPQTTQLSNGLPLTLLPVTHSPVACLQFWCRAGSAVEQSLEHGMAHFLEHMVFKGNAQLPAGAFDWQVEAHGGVSNAATGFDDVHYHVVMPKEALPLACELLPQLVLQPEIRPDDFVLERQVVLEELAQSEDQPEERAFQQLLALACGNHAYGRPILGSREQLLHQTPEQMQAFQQRHYCADSCALSVSGGLDVEQVQQWLEASPLATLPRSSEDPADRAQLKVQPGRHELTLPRLESARLLMLWAAPPAAELQALSGTDLLTTLLAEGRSSRLVRCLREEKQWVESIDVDLHALEQGSLVILEAICPSERLMDVHQQVNEILRELQAQSATAAELKRAQRLLDHGHRFAMEGMGSLAQHLGQATLMHRLEPLEQPIARWRHWQPEDLQQAAIALDPDRACTLLVRPQ
tara:strand:+ start:961 stop:2217 length:1257 start_codon:yes stop_codon:yes gene_type:complete